VAFAAATLKRDKPSVIELRCGANDNITVWVGGAKVIERASEYRAMMRPDRYAARVGLPAGETPLLVKLTKTRAEEVQPGRPARPGGGAAARWEFEVRLVEEKQYPEQPGRSAR
jgi:hypothetical protein